MNFFARLSEIINSGQSRSVVLTGNINDLFLSGNNYVPLIQALSERCALKSTAKTKGMMLVIYEMNSDIYVPDPDNMRQLELAWRSIMGNEEGELQKCFDKSKSNPTYALELLRSLTLVARKTNIDNNLLILIEGADFLLPEEEVSRMSVADRQRIAIVHDWFSDPAFMDGHDSVVLMSESSASINRRVMQLPQIIKVEVMLPTAEERQAYIEKYHNGRDLPPNLTEMTAGLSLHAMRQLLRQREVTKESVMQKVQDFVISQLGEQVAEFKKPHHKFDGAKGFKSFKEFARTKLIPRFLGSPDEAIVGVTFGGPIGGGKSHIGEALAAEVAAPVLLLKGIRSKWYGDTDLIFERVRRLLVALGKVVVFIDEADTQFGGVGPETQDVERRLTGNLQSMIADPQLRGKVFWILMTARIHLLSPDLRRPGRAGDLIIPILDPEGEDLDEFVDWIVDGLPESERPEAKNAVFAMKSHSAAMLSSLRAEIKANKCKTAAEVKNIIDDMLPADIELTRQYQKLQALLNCTRRSLLPPEYRQNVEENREQWHRGIAQLEALGIK